MDFGDHDDDFNDDEDLKNRIYKAGLQFAGPGKNPELEVYKEYQHLMGIDIGDWVGVYYGVSCTVVL